jgi:hypothetical protein
VGGLGREGCGEMSGLIPMECLLTAFDCLIGCCDQVHMTCYAHSDLLILIFFICYGAGY